MITEDQRKDAIAAFLQRKDGQLKQCRRCGELKLIEESFTLKVKGFYYNVRGERVPRKTPAVECSPNCHPCESLRTLEGIRARVIADPVYKEKYKKKFEQFTLLKIANPEMQKEASRRWYRKHKNKSQAHTQAHRAHPVRQECSENSCSLLGERHHPNYANPIDIVWLCRQHHYDLHWKEKYGIERLGN